ncbi:MAG: septum formation initiator family protein [Lachnospiraceae bacterium]
MGGIKQKSQVRRQKKRIQRHKRSILSISAVILLLVVVVSVNAMSLREKNKTYKAQELELLAQIKEENERTEEIAELKEYVSSDEYIEDVAKEKLGLVHENEIVFKPEK